MIKTGIYKVTQLPKGDTTLFRKDLKNISITLYDRILNEPSPEEMAERILLLFSDERGAYKRTYQKRFEAFDQIVIETIKHIFRTSEPLSFHDVAISDGRTALDFFEKISAVYPLIRYQASDYNPSVFIIEKGKMAVALSHTGKILEIVYPPFVFNKIKRDSLRHYPLNHFVRVFVEKVFAEPLVKQYHQGLIQARELRLFAPKVLQKSQTDSRFALSQYDLTQPFATPVDIIRAMNILNPSYFSEREFEVILCHIYSGLKESGILVTGSNQNAGSLVHGGVYQKYQGGFKKLYQSGDGSPIQVLITDFTSNI